MVTLILMSSYNRIYFSSRRQFESSQSTFQLPGSSAMELEGEEKYSGSLPKRSSIRGFPRHVIELTFTLIALRISNSFPGFVPLANLCQSWVTTCRGAPFLTVIPEVITNGYLGVSTAYLPLSTYLYFIPCSLLNTPALKSACSSVRVPAKRLGL